MNEKPPALPLENGSGKRQENAENTNKSAEPVKRRPGRPIGSGSLTKLLATSVAAQMLGIDPKTIRQMAENNEIEHEYTQNGKQLRFRRSVIEEAKRSGRFAEAEKPRPIISALVPAGRAAELTAGMKRVGHAFGCQVEVFSLETSGLPPAELVLKISMGETVAVLLPSEDAQEFPRNSQIWLLELCKGRRMPVIFANGGELPLEDGPSG